MTQLSDDTHSSSKFHRSHHTNRPRRSAPYRRYLFLATNLLSSTVRTGGAFQTETTVISDRSTSFRTPLPFVNALSSSGAHDTSPSRRGGPQKQRYVRFYCFERIAGFGTSLASSCLRMSPDDGTGGGRTSGGDDGDHRDGADGTDDGRRIRRLEALAADQTVEIRNLRRECADLKDSVERCTRAVETLRQQLAVTTTTDGGGGGGDGNTEEIQEITPVGDANGGDTEEIVEIIPMGDTGSTPTPTPPTTRDADTGRKRRPPPPPRRTSQQKVTEIEYFLHDEIFGSAPSSVTEAASAAGASILAALSAGERRMSVDVRDAELSRDPEVLVRFIDLAILPAAAYTAEGKGEGGGGGEGGKMDGRAKVVFPTVSQLSEYRNTAATASSTSPDVVALSTLGFEPIEEEDNLVVIVSPSPDDEDGLRKMNELLLSEDIKNPILLLNHHMVPIRGPGAKFEQVYHLRLLSVQYMTTEEASRNGTGTANGSESNEVEGAMALDEDWDDNETEDEIPNQSVARENDNDAELEAAMNHAHGLGSHQGVTRAMVIRAYPRPWHVFVDTSPDTDADFEVAATFDDAPGQDDVNRAIVECLEGSEMEDELVAQQMQEALESGQLNAVSEILGLGKSARTDTETGEGTDGGEGSEGGTINLDGIIEDEDDDFYDDWDPWGTDTV